MGCNTCGSTTNKPAGFSVLMLDMIEQPNYYAPLPNNRWLINNTNTYTLWFQLLFTDVLGTRRYIPASGSTLQVTFLRADNPGNAGLGPAYGQQWTYPDPPPSPPWPASGPPAFPPFVQTIVKSATVSPLDGSMYYFTLTQSDCNTITSGSVTFLLTEASVPTTFIQNYAIERKLVNPGF